MSTLDAASSHAGRTIGCLPNDVLTCVFEALRDCGSSQLMLPLTRVCKSWNLIAHPLLVRRLELTSVLQLERTATALETHESQGKPLGCWIRAIIVKIEIDSDILGVLPIHANQSLIRVFHCVTHLQYLSIDNIFDPTVLSVFSLCSRHSVTRLNISIGASMQPVLTPDPIVRYSNQFKNLKALEIHCLGSWPNDQISGFDLVELKRLIWNIYTPSYRIHAAFLTRCRFDNLEELSFIQWTTHAPGCDDHVELRHLLIRLSRLRILKPCIENVGAVLPYIGPSVHTINFTSCDLSDDYADVSLIPRSVRELRLSVLPIGSDPASKALNILETTDTGIRTVSIEYWPLLDEDPVPFSWVEGLAELARPGQDGADPDISELAVFTCLMIGHSLRLARKGIKLVDEARRTVWGDSP